MTRKTLYTAIGRLMQKKNSCGRSYPVVVLNGKEYMVDMQEMIIWISLNWRIVTAEEINALYTKALSNFESPLPRPFSACIDRLLIRGLLVSGSGDCEYHALYDLLNSLYIIPANGSFPLRFFSFLKLTLFRRIPVSTARKLLRKDRRTQHEQQVMNLAHQALLSSAEIIKCVERNIQHLPNDESILDNLYDDWHTTSENIGSLVKISKCSKPVIMAIANLYLRQQIIFERI